MNEGFFSFFPCAPSPTSCAATCPATARCACACRCACTSELLLRSHGSALAAELRPPLLARPAGDVGPLGPPAGSGTLLMLMPDADTPEAPRRIDGDSAAPPPPVLSCAALCAPLCCVLCCALCPPSVANVPEDLVRLKLISWSSPLLCCAAGCRSLVARAGRSG